MTMRHVMLGLGACLVLGAGQASAASWLEKNFYLSGPNYDGAPRIPYCDDPAVISRIAGKFASKEAHYWGSPLTIERVDRYREIAYRPWGASYIPRRYCRARVWTSDRRRRVVTYSIGEDLGVIGASWGVEWCVSGLDRNLAYAPSCRMAAP